MQDLKRLNVQLDKITYTSDSFELIREYAIKMIKDGIAYMDDTPGDKMSEERNEGIPSKHRDTDVETNMKRFKKCVQLKARNGVCVPRSTYKQK